MDFKTITDRLLRDLKPLKFKKPVTHVYNPLLYARQSYDTYFSLYGNGSKEVLLLGMNPGPFGMAQTGVPFGEINAVKQWLKIETEIGQPAMPHPRRPVDGFNCHRSEVSGRRVWNWARDRFESPESFFRRFLVLNYCPLVFMEESGRNRTPDKLPKNERELLYKACDKALLDTVRLFDPEFVIGIGAFAEKRAQAALEKTKVRIGRITHPSPANPKANKGWVECIEKELKVLGIGISSSCESAIRDSDPSLQTPLL